MLATCLVKEMVPCRFPFFGGIESIGELLTPSLGFAPCGASLRLSKSVSGGFVFAIVSQHLGYLERGLVDQAIEETAATWASLVKWISR